MDTDIDLQKIERASDEIDKFIEREHGKRMAANAEAMAERASEQRYLDSKQRPNRAEWAEFYRAQIAAAEDMRQRAVYQRLGTLIDGGVD